MNIELVALFHCPHNDAHLHLFRNCENGEGVFIARELGQVMEYSSISSILRKLPLFQVGVHSKLFIGQDIRKFKQYLSAICNIDLYSSSTKMLMITESGFYLILSHNCTKKALIIADWIVRNVLVSLRKSEAEVCLTKVYSHVLSQDITVVLRQGRLAFLAGQLVEHLGNGLNYIHFGYHSYIENIHLQRLQPEIKLLPNTHVENNLNDIILYESGLYRYLCFLSSNIGHNFYREFQESILPLLRHSNINWQKIEENIPQSNDAVSLGVFEKKVAEISEKIHFDMESWKQSLQRDILRENLLIIAKIDGFMKFFKELIPLLEERFSGLQQRMEEIKRFGETSQKNSLKNYSLMELKEMARKLQIFHMDKQTPHIIFLKAFIEHTGTTCSKTLLSILIKEFAIQNGENWLRIGTQNYHVWIFQKK